MNRLTLLFCLALATLLGDSAIANGPDWLFARSSFSHSPRTGARVAQYAAAAPVEGLPDPRATMSRYWNTRTQIVGADGSSDTIYEVHSFGDAQGVNNARWERDFDAWKDAARIAGPFWAGAYWPSGGPPAPGADYYNQGYGTGYGFGGGYGFGYGGGYGSGPYTGYGPNGYFGGPGVPFGVSPYGYGHSPAYPRRHPVYHHGRPGHHGGHGHGDGGHGGGGPGGGGHGGGGHGGGGHGGGGHG